MCAVYFFENKGVEFINIVGILRDPDIVSLFLHHLLNFLSQWLLRN